jgi:hypothetical protein
MTGYATRRRPRARTGRRRGRAWLIAVAVLVVLLVAADFAARAVAGSLAASQIQQQANLSSRPDVTFDGFPFLTQVATRDFSEIKINIANLKEGPVTVTRVTATVTGVRLNSYSFQSGTIGHVQGTVLIDFGSLGQTLTAEIGPLGSLVSGAGLDLTAAGPDEVKATLNLVVVSGSVTWRVVRVGPRELNIRLVSSSGLPSSLLGSMQSVNVQIPTLPLGLMVDSVSVSPAGVVGTITASNVPITK